MILHHDVNYLTAKHVIDNEKTFSLYGENYKRSRFPQASLDDQNWLNRKNIGASFSCNDFTALFDGTFYDIMINDLKRIAPFYYFLRVAEERVRHQKSLEAHS